MNDFREKIDKLRKDVDSGASEFIGKALEIIIYFLNQVPDESENIKDSFLKISKEIMDSRPSMAPLINTIGYLIQNLELINKKNIFNRITEFKKFKIKQERLLIANFKSFIENLEKDKPKIMLISYSSTIIKALNQLPSDSTELYVLESRPLMEGHKTAEILSKKFLTHLIIDAAMGKFIDSIDFVLIGIDSILRDGSIINKIGTYPLACMANYAEKSVVALGSIFKYNLKSHFGQKIIIVQKPVTEIYPKSSLTANLKVHNFYFDITPSNLINLIISEIGVLKVNQFLSKVINELNLEWYKNYFLDK
ncbi:MAG: hypothetical protein ACTSRH_05885 [Promethearchaeota archaeon]